MTRYVFLTLSLLTFALPQMGCSETEPSVVVDTESELWNERDKFYSNEENFTEEEDFGEDG